MYLKGKFACYPLRRVCYFSIWNSVCLLKIVLNTRFTTARYSSVVEIPRRMTHATLNKGRQLTKAAMFDVDGVHITGVV